MTRLTITVAAIALAVLPGCCTNLQRSYVDAMEDTRVAVEKDVETGLYKPDALSRKTLDGWRKENEKAAEVLAAEGK